MLIPNGFTTSVRASLRSFKARITFQFVHRKASHFQLSRWAMFYNFDSLASNRYGVLVSDSFKLIPCKCLINISLKLYFKTWGVFHKAEENPVNNSSGHSASELLSQDKRCGSGFHRYLGQHVVL
jgi:hypothetical protein